MGLQEKETPVLVMYDVRGIQDYIFRTNRVIDVMGASAIIEGITLSALEYAAEDMKEEEKLLDWEDRVGQEADKQELRILAEGSPVKVQLLYVGGGNAFVLFSDQTVSQFVNRRMAMYVLEHTYSLQLATAAVPYSGNYNADYRAVSQKMAEIKGSSPVSRLAGALPVMETEESTGFPVIKDDIRSGEKEPVSYETMQKRKKKDEQAEGAEKQQDLLVMKKGIDSMIAIIHIDGNNMGSRIGRLMAGESNYAKAIAKVRMISMRINHCFKDTFERMKKEMETRVGSHNAFRNKENPIYIRRLLVAGDDITFICNAGIALSAVEYFCREISGQVLYGNSGNRADVERYGFSVCAGIAFMNSHFPFRVGYQIAEQCCSTAKKRAKTDRYQAEVAGEQNRDGEKLKRTGSWIDFQICRGVQETNLKEYRRSEYEIPDERSGADGTGIHRIKLCMRPYYIPVKEEPGQPDELNKKCQEYDFRIFKESFRYFSDKAEIPRSLAQKIKDAYSLGSHAVEEICSFAASRGKTMPPSCPEAFRGDEAVWYDALEILGCFVDLGKEKDNEEAGTNRDMSGE